MMDDPLEERRWEKTAAMWITMRLAWKRRWKETVNPCLPKKEIRQAVTKDLTSSSKFSGSCVLTLQPLPCHHVGSSMITAQPTYKRISFLSTATRLRDGWIPVGYLSFANKGYAAAKTRHIPKVQAVDKFQDSFTVMSLSPCRLIHDYSSADL